MATASFPQMMLPVVGGEWGEGCDFDLLLLAPKILISVRKVLLVPPRGCSCSGLGSKGYRTALKLHQGGEQFPVLVGDWPASLATLKPWRTATEFGLRFPICARYWSHFGTRNLPSWPGP